MALETAVGIRLLAAVREGHAAFLFVTYHGTPWRNCF